MRVKMGGSGSLQTAVALVVCTFALAGGASAADDVPDKEKPSFSVEVAAAGSEPATPAVFTIKLSDPAKPNTSVRLSTGDAQGTELARADADYEPKDAVLVEIPKGQTSARVEVSVKDDALDEPREKFLVTLSDASAPGGATIDPDGARAAGWIDDNDNPPAAKVANARDVTEGNSGGTQSVFTITLSQRSGRDVRVNYATSDGTAKAVEDYADKSGVLKIPAGELTGTIPIEVIGDAKPEARESFTLALSARDETATIGEPHEASATIVDDDEDDDKGSGPVEKSAISISDASADEPTTGEAPLRFTVTVTPASTRSVTVKWTTSDGTATAGSDYVAAGGTLSFVPGQTTKSVSVTLLGDDGAENNETFFVNLAGESGAAVADGQGMGTIVDKNAPPSLSISDTLARESEGATFTVELRGTAPRPVSVTFSTSDGTASEGLDYLGRRATLTFAPGEKTKTVAVTVLDDALPEPAEIFSVNLGDPVNAVITKSRGVATIERNDQAAPTVVRAAAAGGFLPVPVTQPAAKTPKKAKTPLPRMILGPLTVTVNSRGVARMIVTCKQVSPVTCSGRIALETAAKPKVALGMKPFSVKKGKKAYVPLKLSKPALRLLEQHRNLRARVIVFVRIGRTLLRFLPGVITVQSQTAAATTRPSSNQP